MTNILRKSWRDSATLIGVVKTHREALSRSNKGGVNYDILLQTRTKDASSFANSIVFPGGVAEAADANTEWVNLIKTFGYSQDHFNALHHTNATITPLFEDDPVQRHISLRITAIRETFEELGVLICSRVHRKDKSGPWADIISDFDKKLWKKKISEKPDEFLNLCKEINSYPDIWSLHYWSSWLTPPHLKKRFNTAFFVTAFENKPTDIESSKEVADTEWSNPLDILEKYHKREVVLFPPQIYEFYRLSYLPETRALVEFAKERSCHGSDLFYPVVAGTKDGSVHILPGDDLYPRKVNYNNDKLNFRDRTVQELREASSVIHRFEFLKGTTNFVIQNYKPPHHINMENQVIQIHKY